MRAVAPAVVAALLLVACGGQSLPNSVEPGTTVTVGWSQSLSGTNPALAGATRGDRDVAAMTRSRFATTVDGGVSVDESFGSVAVVDPEEFVVRYDLTEPSWSDGIPLDAADLMLAWAAGSNALTPPDFEPERDDDGAVELPPATPWFDAVRTGLGASQDVPRFDEFDRWVEVPFGGPVEDWQTALDVAVPAHVVGGLALGLSDPMEAKQAVLTAIVEHDLDTLRDIAEAWNRGFDVGTSSDVPAELLLSSGPYRVVQVDQSRPDAQRVRLGVNLSYTGATTGTYENVELTQTPVSDRLEQVGRTLDVVQVSPSDSNWTRIRDLERVDYSTSASHDGSYWALVLRTDAGDFRFPAAREAFFAAVPRADVARAGAGRWAAEQTETSALMFQPGTSGYDIALEDAGFRGRYDLDDSDAIEAREAAGLDAGTEVCVLHDSGSSWASAALEALAAGVTERGWSITDCGTDDVAAARSDDGWDAVLVRLPVPRTAAELASLWGSDGARSWSRVQDEERDELVARLAAEPDAYAARDLRVQIEATLVEDAVALPLAMSLTLAVAGRDVTGVSLRSGTVAPLTSGVTDWGIDPG